MNKGMTYLFINSSVYFGAPCKISANKEFYYYRSRLNYVEDNEGDDYQLSIL